MKIETYREINLYTVHSLLIFSWSDTCWEHRIWQVNTFGSVTNIGNLQGAFKRERSTESLGRGSKWCMHDINSAVKSKKNMRASCSLLLGGWLVPQRAAYWYKTCHVCRYKWCSELFCIASIWSVWDLVSGAMLGLHILELAGRITVISFRVFLQCIHLVILSSNSIA